MNNPERLPSETHKPIRFPSAWLPADTWKLAHSS